MKISEIISFDYRNLFKKPWGVEQKYFETYKYRVLEAIKEVNSIRCDGKCSAGDCVMFPHLPYILEENILISDEEKNELLSLKEKAKGYDAVISIGIGGSYLGN